MPVDTTTLILAIVVGLVVISAVVWVVAQRKGSEKLQESFGPEYQRAVDEHGDRRTAESALKERRERVEKLNIRSLTTEDRTRFSDSWRSVQAQFVDDPNRAVKDADRLVGEVMQTRGYPIGDFEQRVADVSVDHPRVVEHYRAAHSVALRNEEGEAGTEDLRQAMTHYRALFEDLLDDRAGQTEQSRSTGGRVG